MNLLRERLRAQGHHCPQFGGGGDSSSASTTSTTNNDNRTAVQDGIGLANSNGNAVSYNSTDAVKAIAQLGNDTIRETGGAIVHLNETTTAANLAQFDRTLTAGSKLIDKLIDASTGLGAAAINNYQPAENKAQDTSLKLGFIAAAAVAATILLRK